VKFPGTPFAVSGEGNPFGWLDAETIARISAQSRPLRVPAGRVIFRKGDPGDGCYLVLDGALKVTLPVGAGQDVLLAILGRGDVVGEMALLDNLPRSATVIAARASALRHFSTAAFHTLAQTDGELARQLLRVVTARLRAGNDAYVIQHMPLRVRMAGVFLHLARRFGERLPDGRVLIRQKVSQAELGQMIGAARENVNRQLADWRRARVLSRISGYYCLDRPATFGQLARGDEAA
jgi:CRP-like cAMP-binding protein